MCYKKDDDTNQIIERACYDFRKDQVDYLIDLTFSHRNQLRI